MSGNTSLVVSLLLPNTYNSCEYKKFEVFEFRNFIIIITTNIIPHALTQYIKRLIPKQDMR